MPDLYKEYDPNALKKIQQLELVILRDFDELCEKNGIDYFVCGGTAIGVLRHGGFIPWDDDIDVGMLRKDYDKFIKCAQEQLDEKYLILNADTDSNYPIMTTQMVLRGTKYRGESFKDLNIEFGIFLDIFCFDYISDDEAEMRKTAKRLWLRGKLMVLSAVKEPVIYYKGFKAKIVTAGCVIVNRVFRLLGLTPQTFYKKIKKELSRYDVPTSRVAFQFDPKLYTSIVDVKDILPTKRMDFSGVSVRVPSRIEAYLEKRYGDYMTLPPPEKRHNHPPYELDFGKY